MVKQIELNLAFVFPGQGSQSLGMLDLLALEFPIVQETVLEASQALGYDLWSLIQKGPLEVLNETEKTQPALLTASVAMWRVFCSLSDQRPQFLAGHSLGEYSALVCANSLSLLDAVHLVKKRGELMQHAVLEGEGAMAAIIGLEPEKIQEICHEAAQGEVVSAANYNAMGQTVISGHKGAVLRAEELAKNRGAIKVVVLPVSVPSHCALMQPAAEKFEKIISNVTIQSPQISIIHNVDVKTHTAPQEIREILVKQLTAPVRWVDTIQRFKNDNIQHIVECGPGKVLLGLIRRIDKSFQLYSLESKEAFLLFIN
ncbi:MAG TPA: ACP S-malonyltransferase [Gammaproteobacteria bacterium]|nr:ACP S-malonyltransferase [Gammaproteobacteria bacterium]